MEIDPRHVGALNNKGNSLASLGRNEEAIRWFDEALTIDPRDVVVLFNKGNSLNRLGRKRDAAQSYRQFITLAPAQFARQIEIARQQIKELEGR